MTISGLSRCIDFNCDLGEGCGNDAAIMPWISSANIACGAHAGDETSMRETLRLCREFGVAAGAHPGYADREHFGRRNLQLTSIEIAELIGEQLGRLAKLATAQGIRLIHVKPHGALYNQAASDQALAETIADSVRTFDARLILVGLAGSELPRAGIRAGLQVADEAFVDRRYLADGSLAPRGTHGAVMENVEDVVSQALLIAQEKPVRTLDGNELCIRADTLCLHGDRTDAVAFARRVRDAFDASGIEVAFIKPRLTQSE